MTDRNNSKRRCFASERKLHALDIRLRVSEKYINAPLKSEIRAVGEGPLHFGPRSSDEELKAPFPNYHTDGRTFSPHRFNVHQHPLQQGCQTSSPQRTFLRPGPINIGSQYYILLRKYHNIT
ncbi:hypothetical protein TNCV_4141511 [Trichonephila clavipes]|nr:hypothetical protein TNCV_4141511 [Trichonephila clavipes]